MKNMSCCVISSEFPNFAIRAFVKPKEFVIDNYSDEEICFLSYEELSHLINDLGLVEEEKKKFLKSYSEDYGYDLNRLTSEDEIALEKAFKNESVLLHPGYRHTLTIVITFNNKIFVFKHN